MSIIHATIVSLDLSRLQGGRNPVFFFWIARTFSQTLGPDGRVGISKNTNKINALYLK